MKLAKIQTILIAGLFSGAAFAAEEQYGPFNYDGGKVSCNSDTGPEIKKYQEFKAPTDRFFKEESISVTERSGWGKSHSCTIASMNKKKIKVKTEVGEIELPVVSDFTIFAHADCGSGWANNTGGKTASVECDVSATMVKYTNQ